MAAFGDKALFGRYWPAESPVHKLDPRTKLTGTLVLVVSLFCASTLYGLGVIAATMLVLFVVARVPIPQALRSILPLLFIVVLTVLFNLIYVQGGDIYVDWGWLTISQAGVESAIFLAIRLTLLLLSGSLLTLTTTTIDITEALESMLRPLARVRFPVHESAMILGIALRFLPQFANELSTIRTAQLARGAKLSSSPIKSGLGGFVSLIVPLFTSVFRHADTLSAAMEARCYHGGVGRTRLSPLRFSRRDAIAAVVLAALLVCSIVL